MESRVEQEVFWICWKPANKWRAWTLQQSGKINQQAKTGHFYSCLQGSKCQINAIKCRLKPYTHIQCNTVTFHYQQISHLLFLFSEEAPASPSTRDAIQGMLSMANPPSSSSSSSSSSPLSISGGLTEGMGKVKEKGGRAVWVTGNSKKTGRTEKKPVIERPGKRPIKRPARHLSDDESPDEQETLGTCFKDSDYGEQWYSYINSKNVCLWC